MSILSRVRVLAVGAAVAVLLPGMAFGADVEAGKKLFETNCASCHGQSGKGDGPVGMALNPRPRDLTTGEFKFDTDDDGTAGEDEDLKSVIQKGAAAYGGSALMAPWPTLSDEDVDNVIAYIRSLKQ